MKLENKVALVTGGASGLGRAAAEALIAGGARAVLVDLNAEVGEAAAKEIGDAARFVVADVTDEAQVQAAIDSAVGAFGGLHIAVSCAGIGWAQRILNRSGPHGLDIFTKVVTVNLIGTFNVARLAALRLVGNEPEDGERGVIINTASIAAFEGQIGQVAYSASKGGVVGMTLPIARDLASMQVRCVTIAPGQMNTPMLALLPDDVKQGLVSQIPHPRRLGEPSEFGALVRHIAENAFLNGEVIRLDGGIRMPPK
ncbi:MAG TPA: 3-hydroxyacyl-CoA dehydrogenase [Actinomycetota bacterium]|jgi:NAD(P)-dependent dehydrogenase (short-subunit alcohol dehydrogenase family)